MITASAVLPILYSIFPKYTTDFLSYLKIHSPFSGDPSLNSAVRQKNDFEIYANCTNSKVEGIFSSFLQ